MKSMTSALVLTAVLAGCATYQPLSLSDKPSWKTEIPRIQIPAENLGFPSLPPHAFNPDAGGLDITDVAILAVTNNPDLKLARDDAGIAHAQAFSASLLPDPQLSMSADYKREPDPGSSRGYTVGPSYDFMALVTHANLEGAAKHDATKADLNLLWQEWQVISQARVLYIRLVEGNRLLAALQDMRVLLEPRVLDVERALAKGLVTFDVSNSLETSLFDLRKQISDLKKSQNQYSHDLNNLLGLAPNVVVPLKDDVDLPVPDAAAIKGVLQQLPSRRPDLLALKSGFDAQDNRYRAAILAQFPSLNIGITRARDTSNVSSQGFNVSLSIPIFNRNQGSIAIEIATRQRLRDEYQQRVNVAFADVDRLLRDQELGNEQLQQSRARLKEVESQLSLTTKAFKAHNVDTLTLAGIEAQRLTKKTEEITLEQALLEQRAALLSVIGGEIPAQSKASTYHE